MTMQNKISLEVETKGGESLYVMVYSASPKRAENHYEVCKTPEFRSYYVPNNNRSTTVAIELHKIVLLLTFALKSWLYFVLRQYRQFFGSSVFESYFKHQKWSWMTWILLGELDKDVIEVASTFNDQYWFSLQGQLFVTPHNDLVEDHYLQPSQQYLQERLHDLLMDYLYDVDNTTVQQQLLAIQYFEWLQKQRELGREVYYICSLDT